MELEISLKQKNAAFPNKLFHNISVDSSLPEYMAPASLVNTGDEIDVFAVAVPVRITDHSGKCIRVECQFEVLNCLALAFSIPRIG